MRKLAVSLALLVSLGLGACGDDAPTDLNSQIDQGNIASALAEIESKLEDTPDDPVLIALALKAHLTQCATNNCAEKNPAQLETISKLAAKLEGPVQLDETHTLTPQDIFSRATMHMVAKENATTTLPLLLKATPPALRPTVVEAALTAALMELRQNKAEDAATILQNMSKTESLPEAVRHWTLIIYGLVVNQPKVADSGAIALRSQKAETTLPDAALRLLPQALLVTSQNAETLATTLTPMVTSWEVPMLPLGALAPAAEEVNYIRNSEETLRRIRGGEGPVTALTSSTTNFTDSGVLTRLWLMRLSLALKPTQPELWREFLPLAEKAIRQTDTLTLLAGPGAPSQPPAGVQEQYVATLFRIIEGQSSKGKPLLPLLKQLGAIQLDTATAVRLEKMVQTGLEAAAADRRVEDVIAFATFKPEVARNTKQTIVPVLVQSIRDDLAAGNFERATNLAGLINDTLQIDFNYDALLLEELDAHFKEVDIFNALSSNTPDVLLQHPDNAALDLGRLWGFLTEHFADEPTVTDQQLKNLIASARGLYGTPTAMHRLQTHFNDTTFPPEARHAYLLKAIQQSLGDDDSLTGPQLSELAWRLSRVHEGLPLAPLVQQALTRCHTLDDSRTLWRQSPGAVRQIITSVRPQFAALMRGIDAWDNNRRSRAADEFSQLTGDYAEQVAPYLETMRDTLAGVSGLYVNTAPTGPLNTAFIGVQSTALSGKEGNLHTLILTFISKLGRASESNPVTLVTNHGVVYRTVLEEPFDFDSRSVSFSTSDRDAASSGVVFDKGFGTVEALTWSEDGATLSVHVAGEKPATFTRLLAATDAPLQPQGRYLLTRQLSSADEATDIMLPPGSLLDIQTNKTATQVVKGKTDLGTVYTLSGVLMHPGMVKAQKVSGYYEDSKHTFNLTFAPPLLKGGVAEAAMRCQVLGHALLCGAHHTHSNREQFTHQVEGLQTQESADIQTKTWQDASTKTLKEWEKTRAADMLAPSEQPAQQVATDAKVVDATDADNPTLKPAEQEVLPPPDFLVSSTEPSATVVSPSTVSPTAADAE